MAAFDFPPNPTLNDMYTANDVTYVCTGTNPSVWKKFGSETSIGSTKVAVLQDVKTQNTHGGTATANSWHQRILNSKIDPGNFVTLLNGSTGKDGTANTFTLEAGTYLLQWRAPGWDSGNMRAKIAYTTSTSYNTLFNSQSSNDVSYLNGESAQSTTSDTANTYATGSATVTISQTTYFRLQHHIQQAPTTYPGRALGHHGSVGDEIYSQVVIEDLATAVKPQDTGTTRVAVVRDQKNYDVGGGNFFQDAWRDRDLTVKDDPFNFVTLYPTTNGQTTPSPGNDPGYFALPAGKYKIKFSAPAYKVNQHMAAMVWSSTESDINKTYAITDNRDGEYWGTSEFSSDNDGRVVSDSEGTFVAEITQTSYFKVIHYGADTQQNSNGFGVAANWSASDPNTYTTVQIEDLETAVKSGVNASDKIEEGNTKAEVIDNGSDGHFKVVTENAERLRVEPNGVVNMGRALTDDPVLATGDVNGGLKLLGATSAPGDGFGLVANAKSIVGIFNRTNTTGRIVEYKYNGSVVGAIESDANNILEILGENATKFKVAGKEKLRITSDGDAIIGQTVSSSSVLGGGIYTRTIDMTTTVQGGPVNNVTYTVTRDFFTFDLANGAIAGTVYGAVNGHFLSSSFVYHFAACAGNGNVSITNSAYKSIDTSTFDMSLSISQSDHPDYNKHTLTVSATYKHNGNDQDPTLGGPKNPHVSLTVVLGAANIDVTVTRPTTGTG